MLITFQAKEEEPSGETQEARPTRSLEDHPTRDIPDTQDSLLAAAEVLVYGALKRTGNKLKNKMQGVQFDGDAAERYLAYGPVSASAADDLLEGSWDALGKIDFGINARALGDELHSYTKGLLTTGNPPSRRDLALRLQTIKETP